MTLRLARPGSRGAHVHRDRRAGPRPRGRQPGAADLGGRPGLRRRGCNTTVCEATWDDGPLRVLGPMASTLMACEDPLTAQDEWLGRFFISGLALSLDGTTLTLGDDSTGMTLTAQE